MSSFYISVKKQLDRYGVDIKVWPATSFKKQAYPGGPTIDVTPDQLRDEDAEKRHEPVLPANSRSSQLARLMTGGSQQQADLIWLSSGKYPENTIVEVPTQGGRFKVTNHSNYQDYSDLIVYELKGDDHNGLHSTT